ncbi:hypothetical protein IFM89_008418 [Coptis chinensis]|uniref:Uncharacterized protein n=1 Tax=Coptis chinensis TaxID=261450 RepID=A0A835H9L6_9MAGN|nr:hypothetical protein IFM89_008418 [Coptis chinensis]
MADADGLMNSTSFSRGASWQWKSEAYTSSIDAEVNSSIGWNKYQICKFDILPIRDKVPFELRFSSLFQFGVGMLSRGASL